MRLLRVAMLVAVVAVGGLAVSSSARADIGHVGLVGGALTTEVNNETEWSPLLRTELGLRLWGPFEFGGYLQLATLAFPLEMPSFGGGVFVQLRPDTSFFGLVPHVEVAGSRTTLPTEAGRFDTWGVSVGGGLGYEFGHGVVLEARLTHQWYLDRPADSGIAVDGWTISGGLTYRLPS